MGDAAVAEFFPEDDSGDLYISEIKLDLVEYLEVGQDEDEWTDFNSIDSYFAAGVGLDFEVAA